MSLDMAAVERQIVQLGRQRAELSGLSRRLAACRQDLEGAWPSRESEGLRRGLTALSERCGALEDQLAVLQREILWAAAELQAEED